MKDTLLNKAKEINNRVKKELGFTVNVGVAHNKILAKMASDFTKPDKVHTLYEEEIPIKMWGLPISELFMLGKKTVPKLYNMQIKTIGELAKADKNILKKKLGKHGILIWEYANGIDNSEVKYKAEKPKGIGNSITLPQDISEIEKLEEILLSITDQVAYRLRKEKMYATVVNVQLRTKNFLDTSHQKTLQSPTASTKEIYGIAKQILKEMYSNGTAIRLIGLRVDNLTENEKKQKQISLFDNLENIEEQINKTKQKKLDETIDHIKEKYGNNLITRAGKMQVNDFVKFKNMK